MTKNEEKFFIKSYVAAVATLVGAHGASSESEYLLRCIGDIDWSEIDEFDRGILDNSGILKGIN